MPLLLLLQVAVVLLTSWFVRPVDAQRRPSEFINCYVCNGLQHDKSHGNNLGCADPFNPVNQETIRCKGQCTRTVSFDLVSSKYDEYNRGCTITVPTPMCTMSGTKLLCISVCSHNFCNSSLRLIARWLHTLLCLLFVTGLSVFASVR